MFTGKIAEGGPMAILVYTQPCDQMTRRPDVQGLGHEDLVINLGMAHTPLGQILALPWWVQWPQTYGFCLIWIDCTLAL